MYGCKSCTTAGACGTCGTGFYKDTTCKGILNCAEPLSAGKCKKCGLGYYLVADVCTICPATYPLCTDATTATTCGLGKLLKGKACVADTESCDAKFYKDTASSRVKCTACVANCEECTGADQCTKCTHGSFDSATKKCPTSSAFRLSFVFALIAALFFAF